ncbi:LysE family translocator [Lacimonas salitolerans]|uniref:LysE family translocator n=1 Tax=Lacimonas salitolerans TaxID=1323750 RepID=A0ABW4EKK8_9RHOB
MTQIPALLLFLLPLAYSPGPGNMIFAANGARFGLRATLPASAGYHLATWVVTALIGLGLGSALTAYPALAQALQWAGAAYVLWLAVRMARAGRSAAVGRARALGFGGGALLLVLNPKAYVIIALMFTQFLHTGAWAEVALITTVFTLNNLAAFALWTVAGDALARRFRDPAQAQVLNGAMAAMLAGVAVWMALA